MITYNPQGVKMIINFMAHIVFFLGKAFTKKDYINYSVSNFGRTVFVTHGIGQSETEKMMREFEKAVGGKFDFSYVGGRTVIKHLGSSRSYSSQIKAIYKIHEKYQQEVFQKINQERTVIGIDGNLKPFYSQSQIKQMVDGIWEYNQQTYG